MGPHAWQVACVMSPLVSLSVGGLSPLRCSRLCGDGSCAKVNGAWPDALPLFESERDGVESERVILFPLFYDGAMNGTLVYLLKLVGHEAADRDGMGPWVRPVCRGSVHLQVVCDHPRVSSASLAMERDIRCATGDGGLMGQCAHPIARGNKGSSIASHTFVHIGLREVSPTHGSMLYELLACIVGCHWVSHLVILILTCLVCTMLTALLFICMKKVLTFTLTRLHTNAQLGSDAPHHVLTCGGLTHLESESGERLFFVELSLLG